MISFIRKNFENDICDCFSCAYYCEGDMAVGIQAGCEHPVIFDDESNNIIEKYNDAIIECMENPNHCTLFQKR